MKIQLFGHEQIDRQFSQIYKGKGVPQKLKLFAQRLCNGTIHDALAGISYTGNYFLLRRKEKKTFQFLF